MDFVGFESISGNEISYISELPHPNCPLALVPGPVSPAVNGSFGFCDSLQAIEIGAEDIFGIGSFDVAEDSEWALVA